MAASGALLLTAGILTGAALAGMNADLNGDGINDLVFPSGNNANPSGTFVFEFKIVWGQQIVSGGGSPQSFCTPLLGGTEMPLYAIADLNNNGKSDFVFLEKQPYNGKYVLHLIEYALYV